MSKVHTVKRVRLAKRRRKFRTIKLLTLLCTVILFYAAFVFCLTAQWASIKSINVLGNNTVSSEQISTKVFNTMARLRAHTLYAGTILTYNEGAIEGSLKYHYPQLKTVDVRIIGLDILKIHIVERLVVAQWCGELELCHQIDEDGFIFAIVESGMDSYVKYSGNITGNPLRKTLLPGKFAYVHEFIGLLKKAGVSVTKVAILDKELHIMSVEHPILKVKLDDYLERTAEYVEATLNSTDYKSFVNNTEVVEYIDLRFGNRVYYK